MTLLGSYRSAALEPEIEKREKAYNQVCDRAEALQIQLYMFNECWKTVYRDVPYYREMRESKRVPGSFKSWQEFFDYLPVTDRQAVQRHTSEMMNPKGKVDFYRITGGTTSHPIQLPAWKSEVAQTRPDIWLERKRYRIGPDSRKFLIWGRRHELGTGFKGFQRKKVRELDDWAMGTCRMSAYDLSEKALRDGAKRMLSHRPDWIYAFSSVLDALARANEDLYDQFRSLDLKVAVGTSDGFPGYGGAQRVMKAFGCPVAMEYGAVETNSMAHTNPDGYYAVFWRSHFIEAIDRGLQGGHILRVTSLYDRCFPLIRYELGDEVETFDGEPDYGMRRFKDIKGRINLTVVMQDGTTINGAAFNDCMVGIQEVLCYQFVHSREEMTMQLVATENYSEKTEALIRSRLEKVHAGFQDIRIKTVKNLDQTAAGKTPTVLKK